MALHLFLQVPFSLPTYNLLFLYACALGLPAPRTLLPWHRSRRCSTPSTTPRRVSPPRWCWAASLCLCVCWWCTRPSWSQCGRTDRRGDMTTLQPPDQNSAHTAIYIRKLIYYVLLLWLIAVVKLYSRDSRGILNCGTIYNVIFTLEIGTWVL